MNKTVLITGASRGIGRETARVFAKEGYHVVINYHQSRKAAQSLLEELTQEGHSAIAIGADVSDYKDIQAMVGKAQDTFGHIDVLVNNAGIAQQKLFLDITPGDWENMFDVNVKSAFYCCKCVLPSMINRKQGKIINVSSIWGISGASCEVHYSASKAALIGFTKALAKELGPSGIQVNCVAPGVINTDMNADLDEQTIIELKEQTPLGVLGTALDIANTISFLASSKSDFMTGQVISLNGGFLI